MKYTLLISFVLFIFSCNNNRVDAGKKPVAKVGDSYLYLSEIMEIVSDNLSKTDSTMVAESYINQWIKKTLKLNKADLNLTNQQKDVSSQLEEYRYSLLIFKYEQMLISQKLDTLITKEEIESYYKEFRDQFVLNQDIVIAQLIKIDKSITKLNQVRKWLNAPNNKYIDEILDFCHNYSGRYDNFNDEWIYLDFILKEVSLQYDMVKQRLRKGIVFESQDSVSQYFIKVLDFRLKGSQAPLNIVKNDVKDIILNKRKIQIIKDLDEKLYQEALKKNEIKIYKGI